MKAVKKLACVAAAALLLFPAGSQAAKKAPKQGNNPVITLGDRPALEARRGSRVPDSGTDKAGAEAVKEGGQEKGKMAVRTAGDDGIQPAVKKGQQRKTARSYTAVHKRDLHAIYILPKGYKDITIKGKAQATKKQAAQLIASNNKAMGIGCSIGEIIDLYWEEAEREGIRPDMALSQALLETGYFNFGGSVEPWQHNYCGLGTIGSGVQGAAFKTPQEGVRAHIQHLVAYCSQDLPKTKIIDPRYDKAHNLRLANGLITKWSGLNWTWAMGGEYAEKVINTHQLMLRCKDQEPDGMWANFKKQQKELEKLYDKKMKEREEAEKKYRNRKGLQESKDTKPAANNEARKKDKKK